MMMMMMMMMMMVIMMMMEWSKTSRNLDKVSEHKHKEKVIQTSQGKCCSTVAGFFIFFLKGELQIWVMHGQAMSLHVIPFFQAACTCLSLIVSRWRCRIF